MEQQDLPQTRAPYPAPPPFWKNFTKANIDHYETAQSQDPPPAELPLELTYLRPPPPPAPPLTHYTTFNQQQPLLTTPALPPEEQLVFDPKRSVNHAVLLTKLTKSMLLNFLELTTILGNDPAEHAEKIEDIRQLVLNAHVVINMYRPHQARESVREMLMEILEEGRKEIEAIEQKKVEVAQYLEEVKAWKEGGSKREAEETTNGTGIEAPSAKEKSSEGKEIEEAKSLWRIVHEIANE